MPARIGSTIRKAFVERDGESATRASLPAFRFLVRDAPVRRVLQCLRRVNAYLFLPWGREKDGAPQHGRLLKQARAAVWCSSPLTSADLGS